jgi:PAS domain S-box-containing protein
LTVKLGSAWGPRRPWGLLLVAMLTTLGTTVVAGYFTLVSLSGAGGWVTHTYEVELAIADCKLALGRRDREALTAAEGKVERLTLDNPRQQKSLALAGFLTERGAFDELDRVFASMQGEESRLMAERLGQYREAHARNFGAFLVGALLTAVFGAGAFALMRSQFARRLEAEEHLHASEERFHRLVDAVTDYAIFMLDAGGRVTTWNAGAEQTKGYACDEIIGRHFSVFYTAEDRAAGRPERILETARREGRIEDESWRVRKDGTRFWANVVITALRDQNGQVSGFAKVTRDLTARRAAEENERRLVREQVARAASETARQEMEQVSRAKDEFLATMSHELRTPLVAISGWATILRRKPRDEAKLERGLEVIERNVKAQTRLVSDLLDVSRIISGKLRLTLTKTQILPIIAAAADVVRPAADGKGVRLVVDVDPDIGATMADGDRLQQVVWNLLSNAVRFTPRGGRVTVSGDRSESGIVIRVRDTGAGIAREHLPHVFERLMQVDASTTRAHGGLGLGLAIVRHLVEAHGGTVQAESDGLGRGAAFTVSLPIHAVNTARDEAQPDMKADARTGPESPGQSIPNLENVRILVVDDDEDSLDILRMVLESAGAKVTTVVSAKAAFHALEVSGPFELVISDIGMPEMDGYAFIRRVRSSESGADLPAIALTAYARAEDVERAKRSGYQEHLAKPVDERQLLRAVKTWSHTPADPRRHLGAGS